MRRYVLDPAGRLKPEQEHEVAFKMTSEDFGFDVVLMMPARGLVNIKLVAPGGDDEVTPVVAAETEGMSFTATNRVWRYRVGLPAVVGGGGKIHGGTWTAVLTVDPKVHKDYVEKIENEGRDSAPIVVHGIPYNVMIFSRSNLKMRCAVFQNSYEPGADLIVRAALTERGQPVRGPLSVSAELRAPDGMTAKKKLTETSPGVFEVVISTVEQGVYECRVTAKGRTRHSEPFTRDSLVTGVVWYGGGRPRIRVP